MADLGSIGTLCCSPKASTDKGPRQTLRKLVCADREYVPGGKSITEGNPSQPSLYIDTFGIFRFRWTVSAGTRTIQVDVKQAVNGTPRPRVSIEANSAIGVTATSDSAAAGTGWTTIGPISITPSSRGAVWVRLENLDLGQYTPCYWDHIVTT